MFEFLFFSHSNEELVGEGIKKSKKKREDIFVVTKLWEQNGFDHCMKSFDTSLKRYSKTLH